MTCFFTVTVLWIFSVCLHEFGHAIVAWHGGDTTVKEKGYLTLNPLKYTHPVLSLLLPVVFMMLGGIGLPGGAVYINDHLLKSRRWQTAVSLAGPAMNILLALVLCVPFWMGWIRPDYTSVPAISLGFLIFLQISAVFFNLLPIPPLDGFRAIAPWLPVDLHERLLAQSNAFLFGLFLIIWYVPAANHFLFDNVFAVLDLLGVDPRLVVFGLREFQFWR